jgi:hypothetical protein
VDDWSVEEKELLILEDCLGGRMQWDLFATDTNFRREKFFSILASEKAQGRNALAQDWGPLGLVFGCPPPGLIGPMLQHFVGCEAIGGILVPLWVSSKAWLLLCGDGRHLNRLFTSLRIVKPWLSKGPDVVSSVFSGRPAFPFLSLTVNGAICRPFQSRMSPEFCIDGGCNFCL